MAIVEFLAGFVGSLAILLFLFAIASPLFVNLLLDNPDRPEKLYTHTMLPPGWAKAVERGGRVVRILTQTPNKVFVREYQDEQGRVQRETTRDHEKGAGPGYWQVENLERPYRASTYERASPFAEWNPIGWWCWWLYITTGAVFVGIPLPRMRGQRLRIMELTARRKLTTAIETVGGAEQRVIRLEKVAEGDKKDMTDHVRILEFNWPIEVSAVATKEGPRVGIIANFVVRSTDPWKTFYMIDQWDVRLTNACVDYITALVRGLSINQVVRLTTPLPAEDAATPSTRQRVLSHPALPSSENLTAELETIALEVEVGQVLDYMERFNADELSAFTAPWRGEAEGSRRQKILEAEATGKAAIVHQTAQAAAQHRELGRLALAGHFQEKTSEVSSATVIYGGPGGQTNLDPAIYEELRGIRRGPRPTPTSRRGHRQEREGGDRQ